MQLTWETGVSANYEVKCHFVLVTATRQKWSEGQFQFAVILIMLLIKVQSGWQTSLTLHLNVCFPVFVELCNAFLLQLLKCEQQSTRSC